MADALSSSVSGLLSYQQSINTISHNIANANTEGYSRQRAVLSTLPPSYYGGMYVGSGVHVTAIERSYDEFLTSQLRGSTTAFSEINAYAQLATSLDNLLGSDQNNLNATMTRFFNALQDVATDPSSIENRQVMLASAENLAQSFRDLDSQLAQQEMRVNGQIKSNVNDINQLGTAIADINAQITAAPGSPPPDLLDQRDELIRELSQYVTVQTISQDDGALNVFIGNGQAIVVGSVATPLATVTNPYDPSRIEIAYGSASGPVITEYLSGGSLGGAINFRKEILDPARNQLGRLSLTMAQTFNEQHREGMDLYGNMGGDFFAVGSPQILASRYNTGSASVSVTIDDATALTTSDYQLSYDGSQWQLTRLADGNTVSGAGPFIADGMTITPSGAATAGDRFLIQPTRTAASGMDVLISDPRQIAAAAPLRTAAAVSNQGNASISSGEVLDATDPNLLAPVTLQFTGPNTYSINGSGSYTYTTGSNIDVNGWRLQITGTPTTGDQFTISPNTGGVGDNRNALALSSLATQGTSDGGTSTYAQSYSQLTSQVASRAQQSQMARDAQEILNRQALATRDNMAGVNLDEEAANLLRFQQAYHAAAKAISIADSVFQSLIDAIRR